MCVCRHGKIQSVKLVRCDAAAPSCPSERGSSSVGAVVAFMDIRCASRAHDSVNVLAGTTLQTTYTETSSSPPAVLPLPLPATTQTTTTDTITRRGQASTTANCHQRTPDGYVPTYLSDVYTLQGCRGYEISHPYPYPQILRGYPWIYPYP